MIVRKLSLIIFALALQACATAKFSLHTNPDGAEVYGRSVGGKDLVLLGKTPLHMDSDQIEKATGGLGAMYLEIQKEGYKADNFYVTEMSRMELSINRDLQPKRDLEMQTWLNGHVGKMFEIRRLVELRQLEEALRLVRILKDETPRVSRVHEMEAGIYFLQKEYRAALESYRNAVKYDQENSEAVKMISYLEKTFNFPRVIDVSDSKPSEFRVPATSKENNKNKEQIKNQENKEETFEVQK